MTSIAIYARYSSELQSTASVEDQFRLCTEYAEREGWRLYKRYADEAISGASLMRPGIQALLDDLRRGRFAVILAESVDRLSRDQEDIAHIYKAARFAECQIVTLSEGAVNELHIGLKGTMGALFLKDLADKTRRGLRGRVEAGKSGGGRAYGYDLVRSLGKDGEPERGAFRINDEEAATIRRIFNDYANGTSPRAIAKQLNKDGIASPAASQKGTGGWGPSTIHGNRQRGTGILNNELYIGRRVWNRLRYIKDPATGKRVSRLNPESEWIVKDVPELRIIDQDLWDRVKARQDSGEGSKFGEANKGHVDRRVPRYILSGLMKCGVCGGGFMHLNSTRVGCATARNKGTCDNLTTMHRDVLEATVLDGLQHELMNPQLVEVFCAEYAKHQNRVTSARQASLASDKAALAKTESEIDRLVQAILDGDLKGQQVKDKMAQLEARKAELEAKLASQTEETPVLLHPKMAGLYRRQIENLRETLADTANRRRAVEALRALIDEILLVPVADGEKTVLSVNLRGDLAGILALAADTKKPPQRDGLSESVAMVAGAGFEPATFRL